ncbi:hypothetical protein PPL_02738 [Heterostelium album PN500]|uniref:BTB domain-containing protein n=1 Tax=Heterostelium pallidum (strain ATCC 26659 / Pp 5 / PN500) TaxID=670386 RepID=D3B2X4_HETP5|nr:hypothetical protein PPL_02738 [Heterostelium album PN500]EFA83672.1 hypothetical protein PPL_02738 [Heterostelium album PN500]|eukprot:XP_020435789.1 hypothetical protein PPL_02738 [Heterostelium album PN500]
MADLRKKVVLNHKRRVSIGDITTELSQSGRLTTGNVKIPDDDYYGNDDDDGDLGRERRENLLNCEKLNPNQLGNNDIQCPNLQKLEGLDEEYRMFTDTPPCPVLNQSREFMTRSLLDSAVSYDHLKNASIQPDLHSVGSHRGIKIISPQVVEPVIVQKSAAVVVEQPPTPIVQPIILSRSSSQDTNKTRSSSSNSSSNISNNNSNSSSRSNSSNKLTTVTTNNTTISLISEPSTSTTTIVSPSTTTTVIKQKKIKHNFLSLDQHNIFKTHVPVLSEKSQIFLDLFKQVLREKDEIMNRNNRSLRNFLLKFMNTCKVMINSGSFLMIAEDIKFIGEITVKSGYFIESMRSLFRLLGELRNTDETLTFFVEFKKMVGVINSITKAITNESQTYEMFQIEEKQRMKIVTSLKNLINFVLHNEEFIVLIKNIENLKKQISIAKEEQKKIFPIERLRDIMKDAPITNDILLAIQSIIGEQINIKIMARNVREVVNYVKTNKSYQETIKEFTDLVSNIYSMDELYMNEELELRARNIIDKLEKIFIEICALPSMIEFRVQTSLVITSFKKDHLNSKFIDDLKLLFKSMLRPVSASGDKMKYRLDYEMFNEIKHMLIPMAINKIRSIPLPVITNMDDVNREKKIDFKLEDINIKLTFFDPNCFNVGILACVQATPLTLSGKVSSLLMIELTNIKFRIDNMKWYFKKYGIPRIKDTGLANVFTGERGIDIKVKLEVSQALFAQKRLFTISKVKCTINDIRMCLYFNNTINIKNIQILNSKHNRIYEKIFKLFQKKIKSGLEEAIIKKMYEKISDLEQSISSVLFTSDESKKVTLDQIRKVEKRVQREKIMERIDMELPNRSKGRRSSHSTGGSASSSQADLYQIKDFLNKDTQSDVIPSNDTTLQNDTASVTSVTSHPNYCDNLEDLKKLARKSLNTSIHKRRSSLGGRVESIPVTFKEELQINPKLKEHLTIMKYHQFGIPLEEDVSPGIYTRGCPTHTRVSTDPFLLK